MKSATESMGSRIAAHRRRLGLTQDQLAEQIGVSPQAVSKWENDQSCPDIAILPQLAEIFGVSTDELLGRSAKADPVYQGEIVNDDPEEDSKEPKGLHIDFNFDSGRWGAIFFALWIVATGAMLLAGKLLKLPFGFWTAAWTTGLVALGLSSMRKRVGLFGICLAASGIYFILDAFEIFDFALSWDILFPALLLVWGLSLLVDALTKKKRRHHSVVFSPNSKHTSNVHASTDGYLNFSESFGENHYVMRTPELKGGEISASFGDYSVDLTQCAAVAANCRLDVSCSFGELTLIVPRRFQVETDSSKAFASLEIQGEPAPNPQGTITTDISVNFGSVTIQYV